MLSALTLITTRVLIVIGKWRPDGVEMKRVYGGSSEPKEWQRWRGLT